MSALRYPAVAGRFYPGERKALQAEIDSYTAAASESIPALGCVVPHAGYMYSGHVAGAVYARLRLPRHVGLVFLQTRDDVQLGADRVGIQASSDRGVERLVSLVELAKVH